MMKKLGLLAGAITLASAALIPLTSAVAGAVPFNNYPVNYRLSEPGTYYCFGDKATILDAKKTSYSYVTDHDGTTPDQVETVHGGPSQQSWGAHHTGIYNVFYGTPGDDVIVGTGKNDLIIGGGGHDKICALDGNDVVLVGANTGAGNVGNRDDTPGWIQVDGGRGNDLILGASINNAGVSLRAFGGPGQDTLEGGPGNDSLDGGKELNMLYGGASHTDTDTCSSGKSTQIYIDDPEATIEYDHYRQLDLSNGVDYNCETVKPGRAWTNHATFFASAPLTTTTTSH
jgi:hypothetical protein